MIQFAKDECNKRSRVVLDFTNGDTHRTACGPGDCQHITLGHFDKYYLHFGCCSQTFFSGKKPIMRNTRQSGYCIHYSQVQFIILFANHLLQNIPQILLQEKCSGTDKICINIIHHHEKSTTQQDSMVTYLIHRQSVGLEQ